MDGKLTYPMGCYVLQPPSASPFQLTRGKAVGGMGLHTIESVIDSSATDVGCRESDP
jgi:hypothetical protein